MQANSCISFPSPGKVAVEVYATSQDMHYMCASECTVWLIKPSLPYCSQSVSFHRHKNHFIGDMSQKKKKSLQTQRSCGIVFMDCPFLIIISILEGADVHHH